MIAAMTSTVSLDQLAYDMYAATELASGRLLGAVHQIAGGQFVFTPAEDLPPWSAKLLFDLGERLLELNHAWVEPPSGSDPPLTMPDLLEQDPWANSRTGGLLERG